MTRLTLDSLEESSCFNEENAAERDLCRGGVLDLIVKEHKLWIQKSMLHWLREREENSSFFHRWVSACKCKSIIYSLVNIEGKALVIEKEIVNEILSFFSKLYGSRIA